MSAPKTLRGLTFTRQYRPVTIRKVAPHHGRQWCVFSPLGVHSFTHFSDAIAYAHRLTHPHVTAKEQP